MTLIEPCNTVARLSSKFRRTGVPLLLPGAERKERTVAELFGRPASGSLLDSVLQLVIAAGSAFASFGTPFPRFTADSLLRSIGVPVQVLLAGNTIHDSAKAIVRMQSVVPSWNLRLWPHASHMLPCEDVPGVTACIRDFAHQHAGN